MPSEKTKKLLERLGKISDSAPRPFEQKKFHSYTNRHYPNTIHPLPAVYDKAKRKKDEDGDEYIMIDRVYGSLYESTLRQKDGTEYNGKLYNKRRLITSKDTTGEKVSFYSRCTVTADGRWFDNCGLPIEAPKNSLDEEVKESNVEIVRMPPSAEELEQIKQQKLDQEQRILQNLK